LSHCRAVSCASQSVLARGEHLHWREAEFRQQILDWADEPKGASTEQRIPTITVMVYKVDRLTRSLADLAKLVEMGDSADGLVYASNDVLAIMNRARLRVLMLPL
jgi:hypothetical protein